MSVMSLKEWKMKQQMTPMTTKEIMLDLNNLPADISDVKWVIAQDKEIDFEKINSFIEKIKDSKPQFLAVSKDEWENALIGCLTTFASSLIGNEMTTEEAWNQIYFSAMYFCKGMEYAEVKAGLRPESFYPRY